MFKKRKIPKKALMLKRKFVISRLSEQFIASAYEKLLPFRQKRLDATKLGATCDCQTFYANKEVRRWITGT